MPSYKRPSNRAIATYAREYSQHGSPCRAHTTMSYAVIPTREDFDRAFYAVCSDTGRFELGNDPFVGNDALTASQLWEQLNTQLDTWEAGEHDAECPGDGECDGSDRCLSEQAGSWCSCVLSILGFEWI